MNTTIACHILSLLHDAEVIVGQKCGLRHESAPVVLGKICTIIGLLPQHSSTNHVAIKEKFVALANKISELASKNTEIWA